MENYSPMTNSFFSINCYIYKNKSYLEISKLQMASIKLVPAFSGTWTHYPNQQLYHWNPLLSLKNKNILKILNVGWMTMTKNVDQEFEKNKISNTLLCFF